MSKRWNAQRCGRGATLRFLWSFGASAGCVSWLGELSGVVFLSTAPDLRMPAWPALLFCTS